MVNYVRILRFNWSTLQVKCLSCTSHCSSIKSNFLWFSLVLSLSRVWLFATPWAAAHQASLSITNFWSLIKLMSIQSVMPSNHLNLCHPLLLLPSVLPSIGILSNESVLPIRWPKYWSFSFSISPSNEYSGLISFRMDWLDLLEVQGTLKSLLQHHSSKTSVRWHSAFLIEALTREDILKCFPQYMWFVTREVTNLGFFSMAPSKQHEQQKTVIFSLNLWREYPVLEFWLIDTPYLGPSTGKVWENLFCKY